MKSYYCDLHIHSCLSPCGDNDMTPANIAAMSKINNLDIVALTDHNSSKNCPAFFRHAEAHGIIPIAGMELTTSEDIHVVCLFRSLEDALSFSEYVSERRMAIPNKPKIFGNQFVMDDNDEIVGEEANLLVSASELSIEDAFEEVSRRRGVCYPAHIDRQSNGMIATLGAFPPEPAFASYELRDASSYDGYSERYPIIKSLARVVSSDAHYLTDISEATFSIALDPISSSPDDVRNALIDTLSGINSR